MEDLREVAVKADDQGSPGCDGKIGGSGRR